MRLRHPGSLSALIASVVPLATGCSSTGDLGDFSDTSCPHDASYGLIVAPASASYVAVRSLEVSYDQGVATTAPQSVVNAWGEPCGDATDPTACATALEGLGSDDWLFGFGGGLDRPRQYDLEFTAGDVVSTVDDTPGLLSLLGTIDTPDEAHLVALASGYDVTCGAPNVRRRGSDLVVRGRRGNACGGDGVYEFEIVVAPDGTVSIGEEVLVREGDPNCVVGRRPEGLVDCPGRARTVAGFFADACHLEAASVPAFGELASELALHGAPRHLVDACLRARADEIRHARTTAALARRFGARPRPPQVRPRPPRSLYAVALDNATEGCVRETFGAAVAHVQARRSQVPAVRRAMGPIAADETRHATLSWAIDAWARTRLRPAERHRLDGARAEAAEALLDDTTKPWSDAIQRAAGLPPAAEARRLAERMNEALWRTA